MLKASTIKEVIAHLDMIIAWSKQHQSRIGYFAVLYRRMTIAVEKGIIENSFDDAERMERLDVNFANRYLQAWEAYTTKQPCSNAWCFVFDACDSKSSVVLQHLLLGINTHINLDLAIAAAETSPGDSIHDLRTDFEKINDVIASLSQDMQTSVARIWWPLRFLTKIINNRHEAVLNFSITNARKASWANAVTISITNENQKAAYINVIDNGVVVIAKRILNPGFFTSLLLKPVLWMESKKVSKLITLLEK